MYVNSSAIETDHNVERTSAFFEDIYKTMSNLRGKLKKAGFADAESLVPQRGRAVMFPLSRIKLRNVSKLVDICGCLLL